MGNPEIIFNGKRYKYNKATGYYILYDKDYKKRNGEMLHRAIWEFYSGKKIPSGHIIHHIDGNRGNNDYNNLMCVTPAEHAALHGWAEKQRARAKANPEAVKNFIDKARAYHQSPEGRAEASKHFKKNMDKVRETRTCVLCGKTFEYCNTANADDRKVCYKCKDCWKHKAIRRGLRYKDWKRCLCSELGISI